VIGIEKGTIHPHRHLVDHTLLDSLRPKKGGLHRPSARDLEVPNNHPSNLQLRLIRQRGLYRWPSQFMRSVSRLLDLGVRGSHLLDLLSHLDPELYNINPNLHIKLPRLSIHSHLDLLRVVHPSTRAHLRRIDYHGRNGRLQHSRMDLMIHEKRSGMSRASRSRRWWPMRLSWRSRKQERKMLGSWRSCLN
jgi:hypothetical protein